jgi:hypothetical protein
MTRALAVIVIAAAVIGCAKDKPAAPKSVTFNKDIAPIVYEHCATCHRPIDGTRAPLATLDSQEPPGTAPARESTAATVARASRSRPAPPDGEVLCVAGAPFSVLDYESVRRHAQAIASAVQRRVMPPWLPEQRHGEFENERQLRDDQIALIQQWVAAGTPEGDPADAPKPPTFSGGWQLGTPDLVLTLPEPFVLEPGSRDVFRNFVIPVPITTPRYVRAVEFRADRPQVLHHADLALDVERVSRALDRAEPGPGFAAMDGDAVVNVFGWSPGKVPALERAENAWTLDPGADLVLQLHMIAAADSQTVQPMVGLFFSDTPPTRTPISVKLESKAFDIPAGEANYVVEDSYVLPADVDAVSIYPHAHYLGKDVRATATLPDGSERSLIWIRQCDFRWQDRYR